MPIDDQMRRNEGVQLCKEVQMKKFHVYRAASALSAVVAVVVASGAASKFF
jgi:predicted component of viral defense system (DUF524 family)